MAEFSRKKSPRAPSISLSEALDRALKVYEKEHLHAAPSDIVAQAIGYKSANNGKALAIMASLRYYGLMERPKDGFLAVSKDLETYFYAPDELKSELLMGFIKQPLLFAELLEEYSSGLPSDANLKFDLIQRGFRPEAAQNALLAFKQSVEFVGYFDTEEKVIMSQEEGVYIEKALPEIDAQRQDRPVSPKQNTQIDLSDLGGDESGDRIPVRLSGGRRALLYIPTPFYEADKKRIKAQIDLLLTEEDEDLV